MKLGHSLKMPWPWRSRSWPNSDYLLGGVVIHAVDAQAARTSAVQGEIHWLWDDDGGTGKLRAAKTA